MKQQQNMRNEENIGHTVQGIHALTRLSLTCKNIDFCFNSSLIKGNKKTQE